MSTAPGFVDSVLLDRQGNVPGVEGAFILHLETWEDAFRLTIVSEDSALVSEAAASELLQARLLDRSGNVVASASAFNGGGAPHRLTLTFHASTQATAAPVQLVVADHVTELI